MILEDELASGLDALCLPVDGDVARKLLDYIALIAKWNRVYNLTAVREPEKMLGLHVLDSLAVAKHLSGHAVLDVGSGAGLPGIPLAIARPELEVTLLDSNQKKTSFQQQAAIELGLSNVHPVNSRAESWESGRLFDTVISRAFAELSEFVTVAARHCAPGGVLAAMKGVYPNEEIARMPLGYTVSEVLPLGVPGVAAERHLVLVKRAERAP
jgi:16S rRNA (guanine527-N7)-methyltransferase